MFLSRVRSAGLNQSWRIEFFRIILGHEPLGSMYKLNFQLMQIHGYSLAEIESMIPFEREVYLSLLAKHIKDEQDRLNAKRQR